MKKIEIWIKRIVNNNILMCIFFTLLGGLICAQTQFENLWDLANYHYYNAFAFLNNRLNYDIVPASVNTFLNPLIELPYYFIIEKFNHSAMLVHAIQGTWFGLLLFAFFKITTLFFSPDKSKNIGLSFLTVAIAATGQATWFQAGTSTNEIQVAFLECISLYFLLKMFKDSNEQKGYKYFLIGGLLGITLGLKSTIIYICISSGLSLIICYKYLRSPLKFISFFVLGGMIGYLISNGWWMYKMYDLYDNPFFPFLNKIFHSPYFDDINFSDRRFIPPLYIAPILPYIWNSGIYKTAEIYTYDIRGIVFYTIAILFILYLFTKRARLEKLINNRLWCFYTVFMISSYILWMISFSIYRYFLLIEMMCAIFFVKIVFTYKTKNIVKWITYYSLAITICGALILNAKEGSNWGRSNNTQMLNFEKIKLPHNTLVKLYNYPTAIVIPIIAKESNFRALGYKHLNAWLMQGSDFVERGKFREMRDSIEQKHDGPVVVIIRDLSMFSPLIGELHDAFKEEIADKYCRHLENNIDSMLYICVPKDLKDEILPEGNNNE